MGAAANILSEGGHRPSAATEERIASSLRAASVDPDARPLLESGRLDEDVESSGLSLLAGMAPAARSAEPRTRAGEPRRDTAIREARETLKAAREMERELRREAAEAERGARRAAAAAEEAEERARTLAAEADAAAEAVAEAERNLEQLRTGKRF